VELDGQMRSGAPATAEGDDRPGLRPELIIIVGGLIASAHASVMITIPAMPAFMEEMGEPRIAFGLFSLDIAFTVGVILSFGIALAASSIGRVMTNIPAGLLSERIGRKQVIVAGALIIAVFGSLSGTAANAPMFWMYRFLIGIGSAMAITVANVVATDLSTIENRGRVIGLMHGVHLIVGMSTPALGGFLAEFVDVRLPFYLSGVSIAVFAVWTAFRLPETRPRFVHQTGGTVAPPQPRQSAISLLRDRSFFLVCMVGFSTFFIRGGATTGLVPIFISDVLDAGPGLLGILFTASSIIHGLIIYPAGAAADKWGRKPIIVPAGYLVGIGIAALPFMTHTTQFIILFLVLHAVIGWGGQSPTAYLGDIAPPGMRGVSFGMYRTFGDGAGIFGPLVATALAQLVSYEVAFGVGALLWTLTIAAFSAFALESAGPRAKHPTALAEKALHKR
jgi:DHA1 family multidrug resistance protein-like MFS transporter